MDTTVLTAIITAVITLISVAFGAILNYIFRKTEKKENIYQDQKTSAYIDFIKSVAELSISRREKQQSKIPDALIKLTEAKARILIYGSREVVQRMQEFAQYSQIDTLDSKNCFSNIVLAMRNETLENPESINIESIIQIIF